LIKRRIRSVKNTKQITKAMELVAASKLRRVQEVAKNSQAYSEMAVNIMQRVSGTADVQRHPFFRVPDRINRRLYVVFTSDRGLAGAFNANVLGAAAKKMNDDRKAGVEVDVIAFGRKGSKFFAKIAGIKLIASYELMEDLPSTGRIGPLMTTIKQMIEAGDVEQVVIFYTSFQSTLVQKVVELVLLPIVIPDGGDIQKKAYEFESSPEVVLAEAAQLYLDAEVMQARIESAASEHAMRMLAMSSANKNAGNIIDGLSLELNATRQASITQEIAEITGGVEAVK
jgi:F-type H+-transporting ATPase subunit gamma